MKEIFTAIDNFRTIKSSYDHVDIFSRVLIEQPDFVLNILVPRLISDWNTGSFHSDVVSLYHKKMRIQISRNLENIKRYEKIPNTETCIQILVADNQNIKDKLLVTTFDDVVRFIESEYLSRINIYESFMGNEYLDYLQKNFKYIGTIELLYNERNRVKGFLDKLNQACSADLAAEYKVIGIDLENIDNQFSKYKLLSLSDDMAILNDKYSQTIQDEKIGKYFCIEVPRKLLLTIEQLISNNYLTNIAFRIDLISEDIPLMEERERGSPLTIDVKSLPNISRFYSLDKYDDSLWVQHDKVKRSLTFEETLQDFKTINENEIVTQVIHLEYKEIDGKYFIHHLDHEYIIYTLDEYSNRTTDVTQKGHKKVKTFKIDNAEIPFYFKRENEYFLYQVLDAYLENKKLISEYFSEMQQ